MKTLLASLLVVTFLLTPTISWAGGYYNISRDSLDAYEEGQKGYIVTVRWANTDSETIKLIFEEGFGSLSFEPGATNSKTFTNSGHGKRKIKYYLENNHSLSSAVTLYEPLSSTEVTENTVSIKWGGAEGSSGYPITAYEIWRNESKVGQTDGTTFKDTGLTPSTNYNYKIQSLNKDGVSDISNIISVRTEPAAEATKTDTEVEKQETTTQTETTEEPTTETASSNPNISIIKIADQNNNIITANKKLTNADTITISGKTDPNTKVIITLRSNPVEFEATSDERGVWTKEIPLTNLEVGKHTLSAKLESGPEVILASFDIINPTSVNIMIENTKTETPQSITYVRLALAMLIIIALAVIGYRNWFSKDKVKEQLDPMVK